jgi:hypothetical protein
MCTPGCQNASRTGKPPLGATTYSTEVQQRPRRCMHLAEHRQRPDQHHDLRRPPPEYLACKRSRPGRPCRARPADRSLVAEDRSAAGVRDQTGPEPLVGPCWVRGAPGPGGHKWSPTVTSGEKNPQVDRPPAQAARTTPTCGSDCGPEGHELPDTDSTVGPSCSTACWNAARATVRLSTSLTPAAASSTVRAIQVSTSPCQ